MTSYLNKLAREVLRNEPDGISKVRFAKVLYFAHKDLIQANISLSKDLKFIRMPLGPVPVGFKDLDQDSTLLIEKVENSLTYNTQVYKLKNAAEDIDPIFLEKIKYFIERLRPISTSSLIDISHKEPSWLKYSNGSEYYISDDDLKLATPMHSSKNKKVSPEIENQRIQASLVEGMLDDIVEESTALEYPESK